MHSTALPRHPAPPNSGTGAPRQAFTVDDLYLYQKISELHCNAAGDRVACSVRSVDRKHDGYLSRIWCFPLDDRAPVQLTQGPGSDSSPRWSDDGMVLAFVSDRSGATQLHVMPTGGGDAKQLGGFSSSVSSPRWAPDGSALYVAAAVQVDPDLRGEPGSGPPPERSPTAPEVAWRLPYKEDGVGYLLQRQIHLFRVALADSQHQQLTSGAYDVLAHDVAPDGQRIAYSRTRTGRQAHCCDLWVCQADGSGQRQLTRDHAMVMAPHWSPDGRWIAFTGAEQDGDAQPRLWVVNVERAEVHGVGMVDVADPLSLHWAQDSRSIVFSRAHRGRHQAARIDVATGEVTELMAGDYQIGAFGCTQNRLVFTLDHPGIACELYASDTAGVRRQLSQLNPWWYARDPIDVASRSFEVPDGRGGTETIGGWLLTGQGRAGPMPLLNDMHGGPAAYALLDFDSNVFWQVLCANGWAVLALNAVGSASYGDEFCNRLAGHWGEYDFPQHEAAIAQLQADGVCDARIAVSGKSYGGYLSAWATGHGDLFKAAVVMAPVGNIETHYGTSDGGYYADPFYVASKPRFDRARAVALSPLQYIEKSRTPTLFMQGKEDERCPKCQSEELFVSLMCAGETPAELVLYPGQTHSFLGAGPPSCRKDAAERILAWLARHCAPAGRGGPGPDSGDPIRSPKP